MKKGQEYIGIVEKIKFPNKGIVKVIQDNVEEIHTRASILQEENADLQKKEMHVCEDVIFETCIVKNVVPGQKIRFRVTKKKGGMCEGQLLEIISRSSLEIESPCPHFEICGGCTYQTLPYEEQLKLKEEQVHALLEPVLKHGQVDISNVFEPIKPSPVRFGYRNKMEFSFGDSCKDGDLELGLHKRGSFYDIISVYKCQIMDEDYRKILFETLAYFRGKETSYYHKRTHEGFLRHLLIRKAAKTGEILVDLVTSSQTPKDTPCTEVSLLEDWKETLLNIKYDGKLTGILHTVNDGVADVVANDFTEILYGKDFFEEEVLGLKFKITPFSFFQTNTLSAEVLYGTVREYVKDSKESDSKVLFDLYSGTGTIAQLMSNVADEVVGVEIIEEAVEAANENAKINGLDNCRFLAGDVLKVIDEIEEKPDYIILDPPRDGINPKALAKIIKYGVENIVYVSCKPSSLARDLETFIGRGYVPKRICPIDQFPGTVHVETVVLLCRQN